eukprot:TRINITY_DN49493_c0_g1_i1.p1 TRINITY_DN49493_c0_g1~~TRINITY_DN49493_c0_g1_i1.p1  ORF type:complete len:700 (+),score=171.50 TRINITY_DN49493_c0_g1_i1:49-2148(+)
MSGNASWQCFEDHDAPSDESTGHAVAASTPEEIAACRRQCLSLGFGGFVVRKGQATFRSRASLEQLSCGFFDRGAVLHVAPGCQDADAASEECADIVFKEVTFSCSRTTLEARSGYFASAVRHAWQDSLAEGSTEKHAFVEFPGDLRAFEIAMPWLMTAEGSPVPAPWPITELEDVCLLIEAALYLDAPSLLCAAVRSWRLAAARERQQVLHLAGKMAEASSRFACGEGGQELIIWEMREMLQQLPRHQMQLAPEFTSSPIAGLVALETRQSASETLVGHIKTVGSWVGAFVNGYAGDRQGQVIEESPHDFAVQLFDLHEDYFRERLPELRRLLRHMNPSQPISAPLCFRVASAAALAAAEEGNEVFAGLRLAVDIFERSLGAEEDPAEAASHDACVVSLFGAGARGAVATIGLEVLARPLVPPTAAAVILSRVLASWSVLETSSCMDAAAVIYSGIGSDRQGLRKMLLAALPRIEAEDGQPGNAGTEWGSSYELAVPELRAAFAGAAAGALERCGLEGEGLAEESLCLLFRVLFRPTGGLPGIRFPLSLLRLLPQQGGQCAALAATRLLEELRLLEDKRRCWSLAVSAWPAIDWEAQEEQVLLEAVTLLRTWLQEAEGSALPEERAAQRKATQLLTKMPLHRLPLTEELLGPPVPAHVLALLALQRQQSTEERLARLETENEALRAEVARLRQESAGR